MIDPQPGADLRVLVLSEDACLHEELPVELCLHGGQRQQAAAIPSGGIDFDQAPPAGRIEQAGDTSMAVEMARSALAAGKPYHVALVGVVDSCRESSLEAAACLWRVDTDLQVVLCAGEASCAWAEVVGTRDRPDHTVVLRRPIDPLQARQLTRLLVKHRERISRSHPPSELGADRCVRTAAGPGGQTPSAHRDLSATGVDGRGALAVQAPRSLTVLLVEDDAAVRQVTRLFLEGCGGHVLEAGDSVEAFRLWQSHRETVDLLVVDLVIPGQVDGLQLADRLRTERPGLKVVLTTGFMDESLAAELNATQGVEFLFKPYTCAQIEGVLARLRGNHLAQVPPPGPAK